MASEGDKTSIGGQPEVPKPKDPFQKPFAVAEKNEEAKLRSKYPNLRGGGGSAFLQKRLSRGQKYFDSGDYNMAKATKKPLPPSQTLLLPGAEAEEIPTPEEMPQRKPSLIQSKLATLS